MPLRTVDIVIVAATARELEPFRLAIGAHPGGLAGSRRLEATLAGRDIVAVPFGVGKCNAAMGALELLRELRPALLINTGCAGAFRSSALALGDVVIGSQAILGDEGVATESGFLDLEALNLPLDPGGPVEGVYNVLPTAVEGLDLRRLALDSDFTVRVGPIVTVSCGSGTDERASAMEERWHALAEAMEGAAAALAARRAGCHFLEIRGISNQAGRRDRAAWDVDRASANAARVVARCVELWTPPGSSPAPIDRGDTPS